MKSKNMNLALAILPLILAAAFSVVLWPDVSLAAKLGFFFIGAWFGFSFSAWLVTRRA